MWPNPQFPGKLIFHAMFGSLILTNKNNLLIFILVQTEENCKTSICLLVCLIYGFQTSKFQHLTVMKRRFRIKQV